MDKRNLSFYSMVFLALALMGLIIITQLFTNQSILALKDGNVHAVETYKINNRMQLIVNLSFDLQTKLSNSQLNLDSSRLKKVSDSITLLGTNSEVLNTAVSRLGYTNESNKIYDLVADQINYLLGILVSIQSGNKVKRDSLINTLTRAQLGDKIYSGCLDVQRLLEQNLERTLKKNTEQASVLSTYNRVLAIVAIIAILIMATIIIKRQSQQIKLIEELKVAEFTALKSRNAKDEFVANMSHELRTPLNALIGFSNLLNQTKLDPKQLEYVDVIRSGGYNLLNIVNDILDLSKIEAGKLRLLNKPFNIYTLLENIEKMFSASFAEKKLIYEWHIDEKIPLNLKGDPDRLRQILINLIGNALKFTTTGNIQLNAGIVWMDEASGMYKLGFTIKDTGSGIPKEKIQTIFERFEQIEHGTTRQHGGTGLGLTIVKNLVEKMGGAISVYSEVGVGSEFSFTCIFEKSIPGSAKEENQNNFKDFSLSEHKILAAEDNRANQTLLKHLLGKYKTNITIAENGQEVINLLGKNKYDVILMDIQMPVMDGYTTVKHIRETLKLNDKVIAMTAYVSQDEIKKCLNSGFNDYIGKPIDEYDLISKISKYINPKSIANSETGNGSNFDFLKELVGNDEGAINEIISEMKVQWSLDKSELETAISDANTKELKRILHRVKSTFSPLGPTHPIYVEVSGVNAAIIETNTINVSEFNNFVSNMDTFANTL